MDWYGHESTAGTRLLLRKAAYVIGRYGSFSADAVFDQIVELHPPDREMETLELNQARDAFKEGSELDGAYEDVVQAGASYLKGVKAHGTGVSSRHTEAIAVPFFMKKGILTRENVVAPLMSMEDPNPPK